MNYPGSGLRFLPVVGVALVGIALTWIAVGNQRALEQARHEQSFRRQAVLRLGELQHSVDEAAHVITGLAGFFAASHNVAPAEFTLYTNRKLQCCTALTALYWIIGPTNTRKAYKVHLSNPLGAGGSLPIKVVKAAAQAVHRDRDVVSATFLDPKSGRPAVFIGTRIEPATDGMNTKSLVGGVFFIEELVARTAKSFGEDGLQLRIIEPATRRVLYSSARPGAHNEKAAFTSSLAISDSLWEVSLFPSAMEPGELSGSRIAGTLGLTLTLFLSGYVFLLLMRQASFERAVKNKNAALAQEIESHRQTAQALRESDERFQLAMRGANDGLWDADLISGDTYFSPRWKEMLGYAPEEIGTSSEEWLQRVHPLDRGRVRAARDDYISGRTSQYHLEYRMLHKDGDYRWILTRGTAVRNEKGQGVRLVGTHVDITDRKIAEGEIRRLNETLDTRVHQRTAELERANREMESFIYTVSHDLRAPLRGINGFSRFLNEDYYQVLDSKGRRYIDRICAATRRMERLIDDLLTLSRIGLRELTEEVVDLSAVAHEIVDRLQEQDQQRKVEVKIQVGMRVCGDRQLLAAALENLIGNAWKYTAGQPVGVIVFTADMGQEVSVFCLRDNGTGFDMAYEDKLFKPFERLHGEEFPGNGVGLTIAQRVIDRHGGQIWAESQIGKGSMFCFWLPERGGAATVSAAAGQSYR